MAIIFYVTGIGFYLSHLDSIPSFNRAHGLLSLRSLIEARLKEEESRKIEFL